MYPVNMRLLRMKMTDSKGITLIEMVVVITIIGILAVALGFEFVGWTGRYRIESQTKTMHVDLMNARARAMQRNRTHFVVVNANDYQLMEDTNENATNDGGDTQVWPAAKLFEYPSLWVGTITINSRGLVSPNPGPNATIRFNIGTNTPDYDCIILFDTRINMGQWDGVSCVAK